MTYLIGYGEMTAQDVLLTCMHVMSQSLEKIAGGKLEATLKKMTSNPFKSLALGAGITIAVQSSAASVGILQALSLTGTISYRMAIPIIMGQNIGTCVTALLSSIGVNKNAKRVTVVHMSFNIIGTVICLAFFYGLDAIVHFSFVDKSISAVEIAAVHSIFNIVTTLILLPFTDQLVKLANKIIPNTKEKETSVLLDNRLISTPPLAVSQCRERTVEMAVGAKEALHEALTAMFDINEKAVQSVEDKEQMLDDMEDKLSTFLLELSSVSLTDPDSRIVTELLHCISDFERISDHAINMIEIGQEMKQSDQEFSANAKADFATLFAALTEISGLTVKAFMDNDTDLAMNVEPLEEVIDDLTAAIRDKHIQRLRKGECSPELGIYLSDLLINCERVSDHCSNIAVSIIQISKSSMNSHDYLSGLKAERSPRFIESYTAYGQKYRLAAE